MVAALPPCRLYLELPPVASATLDAALRHTLGAVDLACLLRRDGGVPVDVAWDARLRELTDARGVAFLIENDAERAERIGADGVHIVADASLYRQAREHLGQRAIIGVGCMENRHTAMTMAELGADYVAFGPAPGDGEADQRAERIAWWAEIFVVPCVAFDVETPEEAERLAGLGADFIAVSTAVWQAEDASHRIAAIGAALTRARTAV